MSILLVYRRRLLHLAAGAGLSLSGCLGRSSSEPDSTATTPASAQPQEVAMGETAMLSDGTTLTVANPTVQQSVIVNNRGLFSTVVDEPGFQFVVVSVDGDTEVGPESFAVERDGTIQSRPKHRRHVTPVTRTCAGACLGLSIGTTPTDSASVVYQPGIEVRASWRLDSETTALFDTRPRCALRDVSLTSRDGETAVRFTVENTGPRDAGFRALVAPAWISDVSDLVGFTVPEGEAVTRTVVSPHLDQISPEEATFTDEITEQTRYLRVGHE